MGVCAHFLSFGLEHSFRNVNGPRRSFQSEHHTRKAKDSELCVAADASELKWKRVEAVAFTQNAGSNLNEVKRRRRHGNWIRDTSNKSTVFLHSSKGKSAEFRGFASFIPIRPPAACCSPESRCKEKKAANYGSFAGIAMLDIESISPAFLGVCTASSSIQQGESDCMHNVVNTYPYRSTIPFLSKQTINVKRFSFHDL